MTERKKWIDVARGLSIILVVMGHSGNEVIDYYLGWFRMPLFFLVSGLLFKEVPRERYTQWALARIRYFMVPYFAYGICIALLVAVRLRDPMSVPNDMLLLIYGGTVLGGWYGVFWFITCLLLVHLLMGFLTRFSFSVQWKAVFVCYVLAHLVSMSPLAKWDIPWNADVALMAIVYFFIGYSCKALLSRWLQSGRAFAPALLIAALAAGLYESGVWKFQLDMKMKVYTQPLIDLLVPLACVLAVLQICYWISRWKATDVLAFLGTVTITIMYLHIPVNILLKYGVGMEYGVFWFTVIGVVVPLGFAWIFSKSQLLSALFLGRQGFGAARKRNGQESGAAVKG
ncbi:acyltransferase family protein [Paenibacillus sp. GCM10027626]|uniref:acyltransferase family protein n=1 Tax=Paenibacillus sp. GCM10027626 TaxID=3273411 RepID=UPI00362A5BA6